VKPSILTIRGLLLTVLESIASKVKYLGIFIQSKLQWSFHCSKIAHKASLSLNQLRRAMFGCSASAKSFTYKALVRPYLEYSYTVWSPYTQKDKAVLESVQWRAARWIKSEYDPCTYQWTKRSDICLEELKWPPLEHRRNYYAVLMLYSILHGLSPISFNEHFQFNSFPTRSHPLTLMIKNSTINVCRYSFFINTPFIWNQIPYGILSKLSSLAFRQQLRLFSFNN